MLLYQSLEMQITELDDAETKLKVILEQELDLSDEGEVYRVANLFLVDSTIKYIKSTTLEIRNFIWGMVSFPNLASNRIADLFILLAKLESIRQGNKIQGNEVSAMFNNDVI